MHNAAGEEIQKMQYSHGSNGHIRSDGTLLMKARGSNYRVKFVRQKEQTQYRWRANEKWILAVYHVQEFKNLPPDEEVTLPLKKPKTEIEVIHASL